MKTISFVSGLLMTLTAHAGPSVSSNYFVPTDAITPAGLRATSASYVEDGSIGDIDGGISQIGASGVVKQGFAGQLYDAKTLSPSATPSSVNESATTQLSAVATMDDGTTIPLTGAEVVWLIMNGPLTSVSTAGVATASEVFINATASVRGAWFEASGDVLLTVLNTNAVPPGDVAPDPVFTPQVFSTARVGTYQGILRDAGGNVVGALTGIKLLSTRSFSGKVILNGLTYSFSGVLLPDGSFTGSILRTGKTPLAVTLQLGTTPSGALTLQGQVSGDGTTGNGFIAQAPYSTTNLAPPTLAKSYTFLLPAPQTGDVTKPEGDGYGSVVVSKAGAITSSGKTGDGVAFTTSGFLTADRQWHWLQLLYSSKGQIGSVLTFRDVAGVSDLDGAVHWVKNPNAVNKSYPLGFNLAPRLVGSLYTAPATGQRAIAALANQYFNARLTLAGQVLAGNGLAKAVTWLTTNKVSYYGPETLAATMTASTGVLSGSYYDPVLKLTVPFAGAVLQKQGLAAGNFLLSNRAGYLLIEPGASFAYPGSENAGPLARITVPGAPATTPVVTPTVLNAAAAGSFGGVLTRGGGTSGGLESVVISSTGALSGTVVIEGRRYSFKGTMAANGTAHVTIPRTGLSAITADLQLALTDSTLDGYALTGDFTVDSVQHSVDAQRYPVYTKALQSPLLGKYTLAMRAPDGVNVATDPGGDGYATLSIDYLGNQTGTLTLADGTTATFYGRASRSGEWSFHRNLYGTTGVGYVAGKTTFRNVAAVSDLDGEWRWVKPNAVPKTTSYVAGFDTTRQVVGSRYTAPLTGARAMIGLSNTFYNTWLRFSGPDMSTQLALTITSLDRAVTWNTSNKILYYGPDKATLTFTTTTGLITGTYSDTAKGISFSYGGVLLHKQGLVTGRYAASAQSGLFTIAPRTPLESLVP